MTVYVSGTLSPLLNSKVSKAWGSSTSKTKTPLAGPQHTPALCPSKSLQLNCLLVSHHRCHSPSKGIFPFNGIKENFLACFSNNSRSCLISRLSIVTLHV